MLVIYLPYISNRSLMLLDFICSKLQVRYSLDISKYIYLYILPEIFSLPVACIIIKYILLQSVFFI